MSRPEPPGEHRPSRAWDVPRGLRAGGVPVRIDRAVFLQLGVVAVATAAIVRSSGPWASMLQAAVVCAVALVTFAVHEAGHVVAARRLGLHVHAVVVRGVLDGATLRRPGADPRVAAAVAISGPLASASLAAVGLAVAVLTIDPWAVGRLTLAVNLFVLLSTLTAGPRSDGVRAARAWRRARVRCRARVW